MSRNSTRWAHVKKPESEDAEKYYIVFAAYTVARVSVLGVAGYEAFQLTGNGPLDAVFLGRYDSLDEARATVERHDREQKRPAKASGDVA
jgi:hypothetical protein